MSHIPVSVIIPCYCCSSTIERSIISISHQTALPLEVIMVNDASPDNGETSKKLIEIKETYSNFFTLVVLELSMNSGPGTARNAGWEIAKGDFIAFLDADDSWHPRKLEIQYNWMVMNPDVILTGHETVIFSEENLKFEFSRNFNIEEVTKFKLLISNRFPTRTVMVKKNIQERFEHGKRRAEDFLLWLNIILSGKRAAKIKLPLAYSYKDDFGADGLSKDLWKMERGELDTYYKIYKNNLINILTFLFCILLSLMKYSNRLIKKIHLF